MEITGYLLQSSEVTVQLTHTLPERSITWSTFSSNQIQSILRFKMSKKFFTVRSEQHSQDIQNMLFSRGYRWSSGSKMCNYLHAKYLIITDNKEINFGWNKNILEKYEEVFIDDFTSTNIPETARSAVALKMRDILVTLAEKAESAPLTDEVLGELKTINDFLKK